MTKKETKKINLIWISQALTIGFLLLIIASVAYVSKFRDNIPEEVVVDIVQDVMPDGKG